MKFLLDENVDARVLTYLHERGHELTRIARDYPAGLPDEEVLGIAYGEERILITGDRGFGKLVFVDFQPHAGVILLRLGSPPLLNTTTARLDDVLANHVHELDRFLVVTRHQIRIR